MNPNSDYHKMGNDFVAEQAAKEEAPTNSGSGLPFKDALRMAMDRASADMQAGKIQGSDSELNNATKNYLLEQYHSGAIKLSPEEFMNEVSNSGTEMGYAGPLRIRPEELQQTAPPVNTLPQQ